MNKTQLAGELAGLTIAAIILTLIDIAFGVIGVWVVWQFVLAGVIGAEPLTFWEAVVFAVGLRFAKGYLTDGKPGRR